MIFLGETDMAKKNSKKGFTLVELVIVIAILAVLATVAIPAITPLTTDAKANVDAVNAKTMESILKLALVEESKDSPTSVTLDAQQVFDALYEAKLNIKSSSFVYDTETGSITPVTEAPGTLGVCYLIEFSDESPLSVTDSAGSPITTPSQNN